MLHRFACRPRHGHLAFVRRHAGIRAKSEYVCDLDEEPLANYRPGGYHPVQIGDTFNNGKYRVLHKVGWGGFSTVWAARDEQDGKNYALKILQAAASGQNRELEVLHHLRKQARQHGSRHRVELHEHFQIRGPNGIHDCIVLDLTGPSIQEYINRHVDDGRLPGTLAKSFTRQSLSAIGSLHENEIGHGDVHLRNLVLGIPTLARRSAEGIYQALGKPVTREVMRSDGSKLEENVPPILVKSAEYAVEEYFDLEDVRLVDFGAAFRNQLDAKSLLNPSVIRAPEAIFGDTLDKQIDLWSLGCTIFELITGQTPFESADGSPESIARQMIYTVHDDFPERWQDQRRRLEQAVPESSAPSLQKWLEVVYFEREGEAHMSRDEITQAGDVIARLMRFEPSARQPAVDILKHEWFQT